MRGSGARRKLIALALLASLAILAWHTMDPGKVRLVVMILLGGFALRIAITASKARNDDEAEERR